MGDLGFTGEEGGIWGLGFVRITSGGARWMDRGNKDHNGWR